MIISSFEKGRINLWFTGVMPCVTSWSEIFTFTIDASAEWFLELSISAQTAYKGTLGSERCGLGRYGGQALWANPL
uniref:Uncharacterized protein n=1 Tax=Steinernema glaseri TaxID=37863 RepID=A0A1I7YHB1_9BILA